MVNAQHYANLHLGGSVVMLINADMNLQQALELTSSNDAKPHIRQLITINTKTSKMPGSALSAPA